MTLKYITLECFFTKYIAVKDSSKTDLMEFGDPLKAF